MKLEIKFVKICEFIAKCDIVCCQSFCCNLEQLIMLIYRMSSDFPSSLFTINQKVSFWPTCSCLCNQHQAFWMFVGYHWWNASSWLSTLRRLIWMFCVPRVLGLGHRRTTPFPKHVGEILPRCECNCVSGFIIKCDVIFVLNWYCL